MQMMEELVQDIDTEKTRTIRRSRRRLGFSDSSRIIVICTDIAGVITNILAGDCVFYLLA